MKFFVGDVLKVRQEVVEAQYAGCKGTTVYETLVKKADESTFVVESIKPGIYYLRRNDGVLVKGDFQIVDEAFYKLEGVI